MGVGCSDRYRLGTTKKAGLALTYLWAHLWSSLKTEADNSSKLRSKSIPQYTIFALAQIVITHNGDPDEAELTLRSGVNSLTIT